MSLIPLFCVIAFQMVLLAVAFYFYVRPMLQIRFRRELEGRKKE